MSIKRLILTKGLLLFLVCGSFSAPKNQNQRDSQRRSGSWADDWDSFSNICQNGRCKSGRSQGSSGSWGDGWSSDSIVDRSGQTSYGTSRKGNRLSSSIGSWGESGNSGASSFGRISSRRGSRNEDMESSLFAGSSGRDSFSSSFGDSWSNENGASFTSVGSSARLSGSGSSRAASRFGSRRSNSYSRRNNGQ